MRHRLRAAAVLVFAAVTLATGVTRAQPAHPNFAGVWVFDPDATRANADAAKMNGLALFTEKFTTEMTAAAFTMHVDLGPMVVHATYKLDGAVSKNMSPPGMTGQPDIEVTSHAKWEGRTLVVTSTSASPSANGPVTVTSTRKFWLDDAGRLVIERVGEPKPMVPPSRSVYRRAAK